MFNDLTDTIFAGFGLSVSIIGLNADGIFAAIAAVASAVNAAFLVVRLFCRLARAIRAKRNGEITTTEFITEIEEICDDAENMKEVISDELSKRD